MLKNTWNTEPQLAVFKTASGKTAKPRDPLAAFHIAICWRGMLTNTSQSLQMGSWWELLRCIVAKKANLLEPKLFTGQGCLQWISEIKIFGNVFLVSCSPVRLLMHWIPLLILLMNTVLLFPCTVPFGCIPLLSFVFSHLDCKLFGEEAVFVVCLYSSWHNEGLVWGWES